MYAYLYFRHKTQTHRTAHTNTKKLYLIAENVVSEFSILPSDICSSCKE